MHGSKLPLLGALVACALLAADAAVVDVVSTDAGEARIDWTNQAIVVVGVAPPQTAIPRERQKPAQRRVAYADAVRLLAEAIDGVVVTSDTRVKHYRIVDRSIHTRLDALVRRQVILEETTGDDGLYHVKLAAPLYGVRHSLAAVLLPEMAECEEKAKEQRIREDAEAARTEVPAVDVPEDPPEPPTPLPARRPGPYTGLVVDCRGFDLQRSLSPKLYTADAFEVWGTAQVDREFALKKGIVGYAPDLKAATRAGRNPLVIRAIGRHGNFRCDPVIEVDDARVVYRENRTSKFLDQFKIVFLVD